MTPDLREVIISRQILLVEDQQLARESLVEILKRKGYEVVGTESGSSAILQARKDGAGVVLMDIVLGSEMDGISAAWEIQQVQPLTSFIFVSAFADNPEYRLRAQQSRIRVGGWLSKPIDVGQLVALIEQEHEKLRLLTWLEGVRDFGEDPGEYFSKVADSLPAGVRESVAEELESREEGGDTAEAEMVRPLHDDEQEDPLMELAEQIDAVYGEIHALVAARAGDPGLGAALRPLRERLESLQELEADAMERRFRRGLQFDPQRGRELLQRAGELLRRRHG